ncbi:transglycosylase SLT domain-containing protein [Anopheles sinensis]|uniref:Transglycosylase SLT domain-containing protein n=1 Tax=Anopheles sinensis TaxID=74873 RepID=A0A084WIH4_ANOSI|nr:transglycosylase SLT domain-containing protein [Anopheles sinensis]
MTPSGVPGGGARVSARSYPSAPARHLFSRFENVFLHQNPKKTCRTSDPAQSRSV